MRTLIGPRFVFATIEEEFLCDLYDLYSLLSASDINFILMGEDLNPICEWILVPLSSKAEAEQGNKRN